MDGSSISNKAQSNQENRMIILPKQLEDIPIASEFPLVRHRWNTNEEIASILIAFDKHKEWQLRELRVRPPSGSMLLYSRNKVRYRKDGYCWKKRKDGKTIREDHMKLKVQGLECIYGSYVHSAILPTFHRRCYWLLQEKLHGLNPDIVLVHYLNVPYPDSAKLSIPVLSYGFEKKEWTKDELADQLRPMFSTGRPGDGIQDSEHVIQDTVEAIVQHLIEYQENRVKSRNHKCDLSCDKNCLHSKCCKISPKGGEPPPTTGSVSSTNSNDHGRLVSLLQRNRANRAAAAAAAAAVATAAAPVSESMLIATTPSTTVTNSSTSNSTDVVPPTTTPVIFNFANIQGSNSLLIVSGQTTNPLSIISNSMTNESMPPAGQTISPPIQSLSSTHSLGTEIKVEPGSTAGSTGTLQHSSSNRAMLPVRMATDIISSETGHQTVSKEAPKKISIKTEPLNIFSPAFHLSHEDVQKTLQAATVSVASDFGSASMDSKDAGTDLTNCDNLTLTTASLQNSDLSLDSLDILDLPDLEKLCSDMNPSSSDHSTFENINRDFITCASCLDTQRTQQQHPVQHEQQHQHHHPQQHTHSSGQTASHHHNSGGQQTTSPPQHMIMQESSLAQQTDTQSNPEQAPITDFCPEWSYTEGSTKVLVTGPWFSTSCSYSCVFGGTSVPALLVQPGVLRCFAPAHEPPGLVTLHVQSEHYIISTTVLFEYKAREKQNTSHNQQDWFSVDEDQLRLMVLERLEQLEKRLNTSQKEMTNEQEVFFVFQSQNSQQQQSHDFEWRLVQHITTLSRLPWANNDVFPKAGPGGMTLLHLAGALGYAEVIRSLIHWRSENPSLVLEYEVDAHNVDDYSCTPLMWACAKGYSEAAQTLYHWNRGPLKVCNKDGLLPLMAARHHGHHNLANSIELLEQSHNNPKTITPRIISVSGTTTTSTESSGTSTSISGSLGDTFLTPDKGIAATASSSVTMAGSFPSAISSSSDDSGTDSLFAGTSSPPLQLPPPPPPYPGSSKLTRRMSEQCLGSDNNSSHQQQQQPPLQKSAPSKRFSVDFVSPKRASLERSPVSESFAKPVRESMSEPHLSSFFKSAQQQQQTLLAATTTTCTAGQSPHNIPDILMHTDHALNAENLSSTDSISQRLRRQNADNHLIFSMDTDEACPAPSESPLVDGERLSSDDELSKVHENAALVGEDGSEEEAKKHMVTLARQIIDAMPERIKSSPSREDPTVESEDMCRERSSSHSSLASQNSPIASSYGEDSGISTPLGDGLSFEDYRYNDLGTPASSLSPDSTCLPSPYSPYFQIDSPPPTTADFTEYFNAPATYMEKDFSQLTLSDQEQRKLYEAAKVIQNAYRQYRDKQQLIQQRQKEIEAAILIQSYYRRYKQYAYFKKMTQAAVLIQSQFRSYYAQKRYKNSRGEIDLSLQNQYRNYKEPERLKKSRNQSVIIQQRFRSHYQRKQPEEMDGNQLSQFVGEAGERELWKLIHSHQVSGNLAVPSPPATAVVATAAPPAAAFGQFTSQGKLPCQRGNPSCQH